MRYRQYKFKFYINASHAIYIDGDMGEKHPHTWEISMNILKLKNEFVEFGKLEERIETLIKPYQNTFLNEVEPFTTLNPTLENCCHYFKDELGELLSKAGWMLLMIEMSETPTRSYVINLLDGEKTEMKQTMDSLANSILEDIMNCKE